MDGNTFWMGRVGRWRGGCCCDEMTKQRQMQKMIKVEIMDKGKDEDKSEMLQRWGGGAVLVFIFLVFFETLKKVPVTTWI